MKCPYLQGTYLQSCKASREVYIPSEFEFKEYCTNNRHAICPLYYNSDHDHDDTRAMAVRDKRMIPLAR